MEHDDLFADEKAALRRACDRLEAFEFGPGSETDKRIFEMAAREEFGKAGFSVHVHWEEYVKRTPLGDIPTGVWSPSLQDIHRIKEPIDFDHDKKKFEVVRGLDGGQPGYIREDGTVHEDPIKKIIT